jgi:flagellar protein FliO/FliZ
MRNAILAALAGLALLSPLAAQNADANTPATPTTTLPDERTFVLDANAPTTTGVQNTVNNGSGVTVWSFIRALVALAIVTFAVYGVVYALRKRSGRAPDIDDQYLKVLASAPLSGRTRAVVVAVGEEAYLVGVGEARVTTIAKLDDKDTVQRLLLDYSNRKAATIGTHHTPFSAILRRFLPPTIPKPHPPLTTNTPEMETLESELLKSRDKLRKL